MSEGIIKIQSKKESRSEPKDDPHIADVSKKQILRTETNHDGDLQPPSSTVAADIDIDSNNDNDHKKEGVGHVQNQHHHSEEEHEDNNNFSDSNKSQSFSRYTDAGKITEITGIAKDNFSKYGYGQTLDNARDALETNYQNNPIISTRLTRVREKDDDSYDLFHIVVRDSNPGNKLAFTLDRLKSILNYNRFHGSKLNVFTPSSGALGNATKDYLTMPYALINTIADDQAIHNKQWDYPLIIRHDKKRIQRAHKCRQT
jgi:hypothetical protein